MKIKRFFAKDMRLALLQVKEEFGSEAVIMSNKKVAGGVEIVAAIDGEPHEKSQTQRVKSRYDSDNASSADRLRQYDRDLQEDRVSLKSGQNSGSQRFANMLKQYSQSDSEANASNSEADSLAALLKRQSASSHSPALKAQHGSISSSLAKDSGLAKMIADEQKQGKAKPKLDPTRYDRNRYHADSEDETSKELSSMREEMNSIRRLLEHQVSGLMWQEVERREPLRAMLIKRLERMGLSPELADQFACYIPEDVKPSQAWRALLALIGDQISTTKTDILQKGGVVALLGPTGVGKTTTIAKLAARAAMEYGPDNVALVTTDTFRIGAHEQLAIYGRIMGCPVKIAKDSADLAKVIYQLRNRKLILVDTAGMGQRDVRLSEQLDTLMHESGSVINSYLVLPATAQRRVLQETIDHFKRIPLAGCILTKIDESLSLGEFISVVIQNSLPVAYVANGQRVPEDIVIAQPKYMAAKANELLEKSSEDEPHYWSSDADGF